MAAMNAFLNTENFQLEDNGSISRCVGTFDSGEPIWQPFIVSWLIPVEFKEDGLRVVSVQPKGNTVEAVIPYEATGKQILEIFNFIKVHIYFPDKSENLETVLEELFLSIELCDFNEDEGELCNCDHCLEMRELHGEDEEFYDKPQRAYLIELVQSEAVELKRLNLRERALRRMH
jgi:hypothetical protein